MVAGKEAKAYRDRQEYRAAEQVRLLRDEWRAVFRSMGDPNVVTFEDIAKAVENNVFFPSEARALSNSLEKFSEYEKFNNLQRRDKYWVIDGKRKVLYRKRQDV